MEPLTRAAIVATMIAGLCVGAKGFAGEGVTGQWTYAKVLKSGEPAVWTLELKQEGERLTGVLRFSGGAVLPIEEGRALGDRVSFKVKGSNGAGGSTCTGTLKDDILDVTWQPELRGKKMPVWKSVFKRTVAAEKQSDEPAPSTRPRE